MTLLDAELDRGRASHPPPRTCVVELPAHSSTPAGEFVLSSLRAALWRLGHRTVTRASEPVDVIVGAARFGEVVDWRSAPLFSRRRYRGAPGLAPVLTLVEAKPQDVEQVLSRLSSLRDDSGPTGAASEFRGLASGSSRVLGELIRHGGPLLALSRIVQAQAKSLLAILLIGDRVLRDAYHFDLVGAHQRLCVRDACAFGRDLARRVTVAATARTMQEHAIVSEVVSRPQWEALTTPLAMRDAGRELERREFFGTLFRVSDLVHVPAVDGVLARQYSEGCYATWEPALDALLVTASGSARPVQKGLVGEDDLAVVVGVRRDQRGVLLMHVEGKHNPVPSVEAVEWAGIDRALPWIAPPSGVPEGRPVPVVRSKLHGHRGVAAFDPRWVEYAPLPERAQRYLFSCGTDFQFRAVRAAFARAAALRRPADRRRAVFTILPGHGVIVAEKWSASARPFELLLELVDESRLVFERAVPQGPLRYVPRSPTEHVPASA